MDGGFVVKVRYSEFAKSRLTNCLHSLLCDDDLLDFSFPSSYISNVVCTNEAQKSQAIKLSRCSPYIRLLNSSKFALDTFIVSMSR